MLNKYPFYKKGELKQLYEGLPKAQKDIIKEYISYRAGNISAKNKLEDIQRNVVSWHNIFDKDYDEITLKDLREYLALLNGSSREQNTKNEIKTNLKNFLRWRFRDWSLRFDDLRDIRTRQGVNERKINSNTILSKKDIEQIMKTENKLFWKTFFICLYESGLRPIELRNLRWKDIKFNVKDDLSEFNIFATKTKKNRVVFVKEGTYYLQKLRDEQEKTKDKAEFVFHSPNDKNRTLSKNAIILWFNELSQRALGRKIHPYITRHSRATELYKLAKENKISKDVVIDFMGHSEDMSKVYTHLDKEKIAEILTSVYSFEDIPEKKKHELEQRIEILEQTLQRLIKASKKK